MLASTIYGAPRPPQPTGTVVPERPADPSSNIRTEARPAGALGNPVTWLVGIIGLAILLIASVRLEVEVNA